MEHDTTLLLGLSGVAVKRVELTDDRTGGSVRLDGQRDGRGLPGVRDVLHLVEGERDDRHPRTCRTASPGSSCAGTSAAGGAGRRPAAARRSPSRFRLRLAVADGGGGQPARRRGGPVRPPTVEGQWCRRPLTRMTTSGTAMAFPALTNGVRESSLAGN